MIRLLRAVFFAIDAAWLLMKMCDIFFWWPCVPALRYPCRKRSLPAPRLQSVNQNEFNSVSITCPLCSAWESS